MSRSSNVELSECQLVGSFKNGSTFGLKLLVGAAAVMFWSELGVFLIRCSLWILFWLLFAVKVCSDHSKGLISKFPNPFCRLKKPERVFNLFCRGWPSCLYCHYGPENNQKNRIFGETTAFRLYPIEAEMPRQHMLRHKVLKSFRIWDKRGFDPLNLGHCFGQGKRTRVVVSWLLLSVPKENLFWITTALNRGQKIASKVSLNRGQKIASKVSTIFLPC